MVAVGLAHSVSYQVVEVGMFGYFLGLRALTLACGQLGLRALTLVFHTPSFLRLLIRCRWCMCLVHHVHVVGLSLQLAVLAWEMGLVVPLLVRDAMTQVGEWLLRSACVCV